MRCAREEADPVRIPRGEAPLEMRRLFKGHDPRFHRRPSPGTLMRRVLLALLWLAAASAGAAYFAQDYLAGREAARRGAVTGTANGESAVLSPRTELSLLAEPRALPDLRFADGGGRTVRLSDFRGKTVLLNVWATWCAPCREEMPALDRLQAKLGGERFHVIALSTDVEGVAVVEEFYEEIGIENLGMYVTPEHEDMRKLGLFGLPTTLLVDPGGRELARKLGAAEWDSPEMVSFIRERLDDMARAGWVK